MKVASPRRAGWAIVAASALGLALPLAPAGAAAPRWLVVNARTHAVTLTLIAGYNGALGGFNFDGYGKGTMVVSVPVGDHVTVVFSNRGQFPHSAVVVAYAQKGNVAGYTPAFRGASSPDNTTGITGRTVQRFSFVASKVGTYAIVCGVPGHESAGMWDVFKVTKGGRAALTVKA